MIQFGCPIISHVIGHDLDTFTVIWTVYESQNSDQAANNSQKEIFSSNIVL